MAIAHFRSYLSAGYSEDVDEDSAEKEFLRPLFVHYKNVRVQMQLASIGISILVSAVEIATSGKVTPASVAVLSGIPLCAMLAWMISRQERVTHSFLSVFDSCVVLAALIFDACAGCALAHSESEMFATCVAYLTVAYVLPQVSHKDHARLFTAAHLAVVMCLFNFNAKKCVPFVINCLLLDVGKDRLARSLGLAAQFQLQRNAELFVKCQGLIKSMLCGFCDALVVMGPDWTLDEESQSLATLLGRPAPKGKEFESFIDDRDLEAFRNHMQLPIESGVMSKTKSVRLQTVRVRLHDAYNHEVAVHVCSASLQTTDGKPLHLVGISEISPLAPPVRPRAQQPSAEQLPQRPRAVPPDKRTGSRPAMGTNPWMPQEVNMHFTSSRLQVVSNIRTAVRRRDSPLPGARRHHNRSPGTTQTTEWILSDFP